MRKLVAKKWVDALRSGKYKQGFGLLKQIDADTHNVKHCCLGVLCEVYNETMKNGKKKPLNTKETRKDGPVPFDFHDDTIVVHFNNESEVLPKEVQQWARMSHNSGKIVFNGLSALLAEINDNGGYPFTKIADLIEKNVEVL